MMLTRENRSTRGGGETCVIATFSTVCPHGLAWNRTRVSAVWGWRLPTWSIPGPSCGEQVCLFVQYEKMGKRQRDSKKGSSPVPRREGIGREQRYSAIYSNFSTGWRRVVSFTLRPFYSRRKSLWCLLNRGFVGTTAGLDLVRKKNIFAPARNRSPDLPYRSLALMCYRIIF